MISAFWLFFFGIAAFMGWQNYNEDETVGRLVFACGCSVAAISLGFEAVIYLLMMILIFVMAFLSLGLVSAVYDFFFNGVTHWGDDFIKDYEIAMTEEPVNDEDDDDYPIG